jgi:hypothetical protein
MPTKKLKLTASEISFLRWLRGKGGNGARSGNMWIGPTDRLIKAGYVDAHPDKFSPDTVHYTLLDTGREGLDEVESG